MLKIKDNVDLKELEKFGFRLGKELAKEALYADELNSGTAYMYDWYHKMDFKTDYDYEDEEWNNTSKDNEPPLKPIKNEWGEYKANTHIMVRDRRDILIDLMNNECTFHNEGEELSFIENTLYDLIQAGLVEKV